MHRQLAALDRWYAEQAAPGTRGGDGRRRFLVATTTVVIGLLATGHLLHSQGYDLGLDGVHARRGSGPSTVATGTGAYSFCWAMGGENQAYRDMQGVPVRELR